MKTRALDSRIDKRIYLAGVAKGYAISMIDKHAMARLDPDDVSPFANGIRDGFETHERDWGAETAFAFQQLEEPVLRKPHKRYKPRMKVD